MIDPIHMPDAEIAAEIAEMEAFFADTPQPAWVAPGWDGTDPIPVNPAWIAWQDRSTRYHQLRTEQTARRFRQSVYIPPDRG